MPDLATLLLFAATALALVAIPGPNHVYIVARSIDQGRRAGFASALGVESATLLHVAAAAAGLSAALASSAEAFAVVKYAGVAYLLYLAARSLRQPGEPTGNAPAASRRVFLDGLVVNLLNPKVALFFLALLPQFVDPGAGPAWTQILVLGAILTAIGLAADLLYALGAGRAGARLRASTAFTARRRYVAAGVYLVLAGAALVGARRRAS